MAVVDVIVIVEPNYADQLERAAQLAPVWIVETQHNRHACERFWSANPRSDHREKGAVTCYDIVTPDDRLGNLLGIIPQLETHHGELEDNELVFPKGFVLEVIGLPFADDASEALRNCGFSSFVATSEGFRACK